jgi:dipeptidyl aminopeptidase/acylaminoacyl peptidase
MSPDGSAVAFSLGWESKSGEHPEADLWLAATDGSRLRRLTNGKWNDCQPRWSPDGTTLAFISDREKRGTGALYLMAADGGEAIRISEWDGALGSPAWSPDGRQIAVTATDPESEDEKKRKDDRDDTFVHQQDEKLSRLAVIDVPADPFGSASLTPGQPRRILDGDWHVWEYAWSPDGSQFAVTVARHVGFGETFNGISLGLVPTGGGQLAPIGGDTPVFRSPGSVTWSPDGKRLAFLAAFDQKRDAGEAIFIVDIATLDQVTERLRDEDATTLAIGWPTQEALGALRLKSIYATLYRVPVAGGEPQPALRGMLKDRGTFSLNSASTQLVEAFDRDCNRFAGAWSDATHPSEVWTAELGKEAVQLTHFNDALTERALGRTELIRWNAPDGLEIEGQVIYPVGYEEGKVYPTILHIHGGPSWAWDDHLYANWHDWGQYLAGNGYVVLMPNPRGSTGRGSTYQIANHADWMGADYRDSQAGLDVLIERGIADPERLGVGGWSYGGLTTSWTITQTNRFKAAIVGAGVTNRVSMQGTTDIISWAASWLRAEFAENPDEYWHTSAMRYVGQVTTPTLVVHGGSDERVPTSQGWELYNALKTLGIPTGMVVYPREPHTLQERHHQRDLLERVLAWYDQYLK